MLTRPTPFAVAVEGLAARLAEGRPQGQDASAHRIGAEIPEASRDQAARVALSVCLLRVATARGLLPAGDIAPLGDPGAAAATLARLLAALPALDLTGIEPAPHRDADPGAARPGRQAASAMATSLGSALAAIAAALDPASIADAGARPEHIGRLYEQLLATRPDRRKGTGSFYTHPQLADPTVRRTLAPLVPEGTAPRLRLLDPAMGTGSLLLPAHRWLAATAARAGADRREAARAAAACLHGVDLDPLAAALCRAALWLEVGDPALDPAELATRLRVGNSLVGAWPGQDLRWPDRALRRDAGDKTHDGVHFAPGERTRALAAARPTPGPLTADQWCAAWVCPPGGRPEDHRFLHWEHAFPEAMAAGGFDAVVGNPPWDALKPASRTFFARWDPELPRLGRQAALARRRQLFAAHPEAEAGWLDERERHRALSHWVRHAAASRPAGAPFALQGQGDLNAYKLFTELSLALLRPGGRLGLLLPAALYTDRGAAPLRAALLTRCRWEWLFAFENRARAFAIDSRYKYCVVVAERGGPTEAVRAAFMRRDPADWERAEHIATPMPASRLRPSGAPAMAELDEADRRLLHRLAAGGVPIAGDGTGPWALRWATELHTTSHAPLFPPRPDWEARGYRPSALGLWLRGGWSAPADGAIPSADGATGIPPAAVDGVAIPLWEGRMIGHLDPATKAWVEGRGRRARWRAVPWHEKRLGPQFLIDRETLGHPRVLPGPKVAYGRVTSATNTRTVAAALLPTGAAADSVFMLRPTVSPSPGSTLTTALALTGVLGSLLFDAQLRRRLGGLNLSRFVMVEATLPPPGALPPALPLLVARLAMAHPLFSREWRALSPLLGGRPAASLWALTRHERLRLGAQLDAAVAHAWGFTASDLAELLADCAHPADSSAALRRTLPPRGHWRVDRTEPPQVRTTVLAVAALHALERDGMDRFLATADHEGWELPEALDLTALGLPAAPGPRPVAALLGPRHPAARPPDTTDRDAAWLDALLPR